MYKSIITTIIIATFLIVGSFLFVLKDKSIIDKKIQPITISQGCQFFSTVNDNFWIAKNSGHICAEERARVINGSLMWVVTIPSNNVARSFSISDLEKSVAWVESYPMPDSIK